MKKTLLFAAVLAAMTLASCQRIEPAEQIVESPHSAESLVFTATTESSVTKTALSENGEGYDVVWRSGDRITIIDGAATPNVGEYSTTSTTTQASFTFVPESGAAAETSPYKAWYPASLYNEVTPTLPATQTYVEGNIGGSPMYAESSTETLSFKNICGIICLNLSTGMSDIAVSSISLSADEPMSGPISNVASLSSETPVAATVSGTAGVTLECSTGVAINGTAKPFYIAVPAGTYNSLKITVVTTDGEVQTRTSNKGIEVSRSQITNITLAFNTMAATTGSADIVGGVSQPWVQLWAGGPKWAKFNVGSTITSYENVTEWTEATIGTYYNAPSDIATAIWGVNWKLPNATTASDNDFADLFSKCDWEWCDGSNVQYEPGCTLTGFKFTGKDPGYTNNSIFLPAAGEKNWDTLMGFQTAVAYWHSFTDGSQRYLLYRDNTGTFDPGAHGYPTQWKHTVRAICIDDQTYEAGKYYASSSNIGDVVAVFNASAYDNPTLILTEDVSASITITRADGIIDFNGKTVSGNMFLQNNVAGETVTLKNGTLSADLDGKGDWYDWYDGGVVLEDMTITGDIYTDGHAYEFISGSYNGAINNYVADGKPGTVIIRDGLFRGNYETNGDHGLRNNCDKGTYTLYGGKFAISPTNANQTCVSGYSVQANTGGDSSTYPYVVAAIPPPATLADLKDMVNADNDVSSYLGRYVYSDGSIGTEATDAIGLVAYASRTSEVVTNINEACRILVLRTVDIDAQRYGDDTGWAKNTVSALGQAIAAVSWSNWLIPTHPQWEAIYGADGLGAGNFTNLCGESSLAKLDAERVYWSSTGLYRESGYSWWWIMDVIQNGTWSTRRDDTNYCYTRAIFGY